MPVIVDPLIRPSDHARFPARKARLSGKKKRESEVNVLFVQPEWITLISGIIVGVAVEIQF